MLMPEEELRLLSQQSADDLYALLYALRDPTLQIYMVCTCSGS